MKKRTARTPSAAPRLQELRDRGLTVHVSHRRPIAFTADQHRQRATPIIELTGRCYTRHELEKQRARVSPTGGITTVTVVDPALGEAGDVVAMGLALCRIDEPFDRRRALHLALTRVNQALRGRDRQES